MFLVPKNAKAFAILSIIASDRGDRPMPITEPYINGRECGFAMMNYKLNTKVAFSENRNSDQIVVYCGLTHGFGDGNVPDEHVYKARECFGENEYVKAATYIQEFLGDC